MNFLCKFDINYQEKFFVARCLGLQIDKMN